MGLQLINYTINLFMVIFSFALVVACGYILGKLDKHIDLLGQDNAWIVISAIMVTGVIILLVSVLGCCGAMKKNKCMLWTYFVIMLLLLLTVVITGGLAYGYKNLARHTVHDFMKDSMLTYNPKDDNSSTTNSWDGIQSWVHCCGIDNASDWSMYSNYYGGSNSTTGSQNLDTNLEWSNKTEKQNIYKRSVTYGNNSTRNSTNSTRNSTTSTRNSNNSTRNSTNSTRNSFVSHGRNSSRDLLFPSSCLLQGSTIEPYPHGCLDKAESWIFAKIWILVGITAGIVGAMVLSICCVFHWLRRKPKEEDTEMTTFSNR